MQICVEQRSDLLRRAAISKNAPRQSRLGGTPLVDHFLQSGVHVSSLAPRSESGKGSASTPAQLSLSRRRPGIQPKRPHDAPRNSQGTCATVRNS